ncbi:hypothetical protein PQX77_015080 [Marasmius sp. AFHP31]|nr:hypothetical protein PQX77_015080 [Marasmius sp. AFHP31]
MLVYNLSLLLKSFLQTPTPLDNGQMIAPTECLALRTRVEAGGAPFGVWSPPNNTSGETPDNGTSDHNGENNHSAASGKASIGPIVSGVVGGVTFIALLGLLFWFTRHRKRGPKEVPNDLLAHEDRRLSGDSSPAVSSQPMPTPKAFAGRARQEVTENSNPGLNNVRNDTSSAKAPGQASEPQIRRHLDSGWRPANDHCIDAPPSYEEAR